MLQLGGHTLRVGGRFLNDGSGAFAMADDADSLVVAKSVQFEWTGLGHPSMSAGVIRTQGDFVVGQYGYGTTFVASGSHKVVLDGTGTQKIDLHLGGEVSSRFQNLTLSNPDSVTFATFGVVQDTARLTAGKAVGGPVAIGNALINAGGTWRPGSTHFNGPTAYVPNAIGSDVYFDHDLQLASNLTTTDSVFVQDYVLHLGGHRLTVGGSFRDTGAGKLEMLTAADTLAVGKNVYMWQDEGLATDTAGVLMFGRDFTVDGVFGTIQAGGSHKVVFTGGGAGTLHLASGSSLNDLALTGAGTLTVAGELDLSRDVSLAAASHLVVPDSTSVDVQGALSNAGLIDVQAGGSLGVHSHITNSGTINVDVAGTMYGLDVTNTGAGVVHGSIGSIPT
jgi:hypothetical protein